MTALWSILRFLAALPFLGLGCLLVAAGFEIAGRGSATGFLLRFVGVHVGDEPPTPPSG